MEQKNKYIYELDVGEAAQVRCVPTGVTEPRVQAVLDGRTLAPSPAGELSFQFTFFGNERVLQIQAEFLNPQPDSRYDIFIRSSNREEKLGPTLDPENR